MLVDLASRIRKYFHTVLTKTNLAQSDINLRSVDALRGILATYVIMGHCRWLLWAGNSAWIQHPHFWGSNILVYASASLRYGHEAVMVFFVLSGFFIHLRASKQLAQGNFSQINVSNFFRRRAHRLVPPYVFALGLTVILDLIGSNFYPTLYSSRTGDSMLDSNFLQKGFSVASVVPAVFMLPSSCGKDFGTNGPLWSLAYEVVYYILYPGWLRLRQLGAWAAYGAGVFLAVLVNFFIDAGFASGVLIHYPIWLIGAAIAELLVKGKLPRWGIVASSLLLPVAFVALNFHLPSLLTILFSAVLGSSVVLLVVKLPSSVCSDPIHRLFEALGRESYTIYICHFPIVALMSAWAIEVLGGRPMDGWLAVGGTLLTILLCHVIFLRCERHFIHDRLRVRVEN